MNFRKFTPQLEQRYLLATSISAHDPIKGGTLSKELHSVLYIIHISALLRYVLI